MTDFTQNNSIGDVLTHYEAEKFIEELSIIDVREYGSQKWFKQDEFLQKLNMQAHVNAMMRSDEFIMDTCVTWDKVKFLIYDLVVSELWKQHVLPKIRSDIIKLNSYRSYITIYHESVVCNILEIIMFHRTAVESADEYLMELIDYCYRKLVYLTQHPQTKKVEKLDPQQVINKTPEEDYSEQQKDIEFKIAMMCLSLIRYISDYVKHLPIGITHHLLVETDILCILVPLIEDKPWLRINANNEREKFENGKWQVVPKSDYGRLPKLEAQVWITIYNLFMDPECRQKYELTDFRKNNLLRLRKYMNEVLLDQIPNLSLMLRNLEELSMMNVQSMVQQNPLIVQTMPEIRTQILEKYKKEWNEIAKYQKDNFFNQDKKQQEQDMQKLAELYGQNVVEGLLDGFKCQKCQKEATKRCSRCKSVWYCSRECQLEDWKNHKPTCTVFSEEQKQKDIKKQKDNEEKEKLLKNPQEATIDIKNIHNQKKPGIQEIGQTQETEKQQQQVNDIQKKDNSKKEDIKEEEVQQQQQEVTENLDELD